MKSPLDRQLSSPSRAARVLQRTCWSTASLCASLCAASLGLVACSDDNLGNQDELNAILKDGDLTFLTAAKLSAPGMPPGPPPAGTGAAGSSGASDGGVIVDAGMGAGGSVNTGGGGFVGDGGDMG